MVEGIEREPLKAPFPYFGGKARIAGAVWERLGNVHNYVEPFGGSLAVLLGRPVEHQWWLKRETVGDFTGHVVNFYRAVRSDPDGVAVAAAYPVTEADLTARHLWLVRYHDELAEKLAADPFFYDVEAAGWWVWGISAWVGGEWCSGLGPWHPDENGVPDDGPGVYRKMPMIAGNHGGKGIHRPVTGKDPVMEDGFPDVRGMYEGELKSRFRLLADRLFRVRIACGDWSRLTKSAVTPSGKEITGIFLDPPYDLGLRRGDLYGPSDRSGGKKKKGVQNVAQVHDDARTWALERGAESNLRIAYCAYSTDEEAELFLSASWVPLRWSAAGGYGLQSNREAKENRNREIIWFSPHCLRTDNESVPGKEEK